ncbi:MAG: DNRLRE domain-containing protein [Polyangiaceae bacterium]
MLRALALASLLVPAACVLVDPLEDDYALKTNHRGGGRAQSTGGANEGCDPTTGGGGNGGNGTGGSGLSGPITMTFGERNVAEVNGVTSDTQLSGFPGSLGENWGASESAWADASPSELRVALVRFDLTSIPNDAAIVAAELSLFTSTLDLAFSMDPANIFEVLEPWDEGNVSGAPGIANWNDRMPGVPWTTPGCGPGSRSTTSIASLTAVMTGSEYVFALPTDLVERWVSTPSDNHGLVLHTAFEDGTGIATSESTLLNHRPMLTVTFDP